MKEQLHVSTRITAAAALSASLFHPIWQATPAEHAVQPEIAMAAAETLVPDAADFNTAIPEEPVAGSETAFRFSASPTESTDKQGQSGTGKGEYPLLSTGPLQIPAYAEETFARDAAYISLGDGFCSGFLIRDSNGQAIGVETAEHCFGNYFAGNRVVNQNAVMMSGPVDVYSGLSQKTLVFDGRINQVILNGPKDIEHDQAIGVFGNQDPLAVLGLYDASHLSLKAIQHLQKGSVLYEAGWPAAQPKNNGAPSLQEFALNVLGVTHSPVSNGDYLQVLQAAGRVNQDGSECSPGNSGGQATIFVPYKAPDGQIIEMPEAIGTLSEYSDFGRLMPKQEGQENKAYAEQKYGVNLNGENFICGFEVVPPSPTDNMQIDKVEIYNFKQIEQDQQNFANNFFEPSTVRDVINGMVYLNFPLSEQEGIWIKNPAYSFDPTTQTLVLGYACPSSDSYRGSGGICTQVLTNSQITDNVFIYGENGENISSTSTGNLTVVEDANQQISYTDPSGLQFGQYQEVPVDSLEGTIPYELGISQSNQLVFNLLTDSGK